MAIPDLDPDHVRRLRDAIAAAPGPVFVHCGAGQRACALGLLATEVASGAELIARAEQVGTPVTDERLRAFVREQADREGWTKLQAV